MTSLQRFLYGGPGGAAAIADAGLLVLRLFAGLALALEHGLGKIPPSEGFVGMIGQTLPVPVLFAWLSGIAEFGGGLLLAIGLFTRPAALLITINMSFAMLLAHLDDPFGGMELALFFLATGICFVLAGAGRYSIDGVLRSRVEADKVSRYTRS